VCASVWVCTCVCVYMCVCRRTQHTSMASHTTYVNLTRVLNILYHPKRTLIYYPKTIIPTKTYNTSSFLPTPHITHLLCVFYCVCCVRVYARALMWECVGCITQTHYQIEPCIYIYIYIHVYMYVQVCVRECVPTQGPP